MTLIIEDTAAELTASALAHADSLATKGDYKPMLIERTLTIGWERLAEVGRDVADQFPCIDIIVKQGVDRGWTLRVVALGNDWTVLYDRTVVNAGC